MAGAHKSVATLLLARTPRFVYKRPDLHNASVATLLLARTPGFDATHSTLLARTRRCAHPCARWTVRPEIPAEWNRGLQAVISMCWNDDPALRMDMASVVLHLKRIISIEDLDDAALVGEEAAEDVAAENGTMEEIASSTRELGNLVKTETYKAIETVEANVQMGKRLGGGATADVFLGIFAGQKCAVKVFRTSSSEDSFKEVKLMYAMRHPAVIGIYAWFLKKELGRLAIVMELAEGGELTPALKKKKGGLTLLQALVVAADVAKGLAHMHSFPVPIIHRDIKPDNIMMMGDGRGKVADVGQSRRLSAHTMTATGTPLYAAPELVRGEHYDELADVYSFGMVLVGFE